MNNTFHDWTPLVTYLLNDIVLTETIKFLKRKPSRFNKKKLQAITIKSYYKAIK